MSTEEQHMLESGIRSRLHDNLADIDTLLGESADIIRRNFRLADAAGEGRPGQCIYTDGLVKAEYVNDILRALIVYAAEISFGLNEEEAAQQLQERLLVNGGVSIVERLGSCIDAVLAGDTVILIEGIAKGIVISTRGWEGRSVDEPATESVVRGPRDGFVESIRSNSAHIRRRIRDPMLRVDALQVGTRTKTDINVLYIKGLVKKGLVEEVTKRLRSIKVDGILESGYIEEFIEDAPLSPFTTIQSTERPDKAASALLEGRAVILVDNTPFCLIVPTYFWQSFQASDDYYSRYWVGSFLRLVRYLAFMISLALPSVYVMLVSFHQEMIPTGLAFTIASGREVVPFPVLLEALFMEFAFELMREAGLRMPKPVGQAVSIVGSLIIGQAAVQAGLVSPFMVIIVAITGISSFAIPNYAASFSIRLIRFPLLLASGTMGLLGFVGVFFTMVVHAISLRSFGEPYLAPASPFRPSDQQDLLLRFPWWSMIKRPWMAEGEPDRMAKGQRPQPDATAEHRPHDQAGDNSGDSGGKEDGA
ncbi:spore germination protein [Paenibacillus mesotrionivorans]|uniref:Spore germination protein n=1 Tax=Paenibacillus mesotrionivorans TaxID=3160968 RepID=A0ACC7NXH3_9BACL